MALTNELNSLGFSPKPPIGEQVSSSLSEGMVLPKLDDLVQQEIERENKRKEKKRKKRKRKRIK